MIFVAAASRRLGRWLVGLFVIAQIFGVVPLMSGHTLHVVESDLELSSDTSKTATIPQGHHHGDADGFILHHELQDLSGVFLCPTSQCEIGSLPAAIVAFAWNALAENAPALLERPPKSFLSI
jgi:hypothetical protein